ncbi:MAG: hypothetical protein JSV97_10010 [candidate division WOR-3 bacterium]|nr:MAG: hypothetical protein JSV97_10010 [candidate division WOR-3 bacterium]
MHLKERQKLWRIGTYSLSFILTFALGFNGVMAEEMEKKEKLIFASIVFPTESSEKNVLLLVESIRAFAGSLSQVPIWCLMPEYGKQLSTTTQDKLAALNVTLIPFEIDYETLRFPFTGDAQAAAVAESMANAKADFLVWLGANTIVLQEPSHLLLPDDKSLGYRPVHHINVGSPYDRPLDPFWILVYQYCSVPKDRIFAMTTHVDDTKIRPYFNAGVLVTRPEKHLLRNWRDTFFRVYQKPDLQKCYRQDNRYAIFIHQAVLSGVILSEFAMDEIQELPATYNYPLHLYAEDSTDYRPSSLEELVTFRHEGFYEDPEWIEKMPAGASLKQWFIERLAQ